MKPTKVHYLGVLGRNRKLRPLSIAAWQCFDIHMGVTEYWAVTGSANVEEARRRVARVREGAKDNGVRRLK